MMKLLKIFSLLVIVITSFLFFSNSVSAGCCQESTSCKQITDSQIGECYGNYSDGQFCDNTTGLCNYYYVCDPDFNTCAQLTQATQSNNYPAFYKTQDECSQQCGSNPTASGCCVPENETADCYPALPGNLCSNQASIKFMYYEQNCSDLEVCPDIGTAPTGTTTDIDFQNPTRYTKASEVLYAVLKYIQTIIVILATVFIVLGGIIYMTSSGNDSRVKIAKGMLTGAVVGFAVALMAPTFLRETMTILGGTPQTGSSAGEWVKQSLTLKEIISKVLAFLLSIVGVLSVVTLVIAGIMYLTATGSEDRIDTAKKLTVYAVIGIVVAFSALVILNQVAKFFGV